MEQAVNEIFARAPNAFRSRSTSKIVKEGEESKEDKEASVDEDLPVDFFAEGGGPLALSLRSLVGRLLSDYFAGTVVRLALAFKAEKWTRFGLQRPNVAPAPCGNRVKLSDLYLLRTQQEYLCSTAGKSGNKKEPLSLRGRRLSGGSRKLGIAPLAASAVPAFAKLVRGGEDEGEGEGAGLSSVCAFCSGTRENPFDVIADVVDTDANDDNNNDKNDNENINGLDGIFIDEAVARAWREGGGESGESGESGERGEEEGHGGKDGEEQKYESHEQEKSHADYAFVELGKSPSPRSLVMTGATIEFSRGCADCVAFMESLPAPLASDSVESVLRPLFRSYVYGIVTAFVPREYLDSLLRDEPDKDSLNVPHRFALLRTEMAAAAASSAVQEATTAAAAAGTEEQSLRYRSSTTASSSSIGGGGLASDSQEGGGANSEAGLDEQKTAGDGKDGGRKRKGSRVTTATLEGFFLGTRKSSTTSGAAAPPLSPLSSATSSSLDDPSTLFGLRERAVAAESIAFAVHVLLCLRTRIEVATKSKSQVDAFFAFCRQLLREGRGIVYYTISCQVLANTDLLTDVQRVRWNTTAMEEVGRFASRFVCCLRRLLCSLFSALPSPAVPCIASHSTALPCLALACPVLPCRIEWGILWPCHIAPST